MALELADRWVWDFWLVQDEGLWHVFYLHAPQTPDDPDKRHFSARIGHGISIDLSTWQVVDDVLTLGPAGAWDDMATWTGSIVAHPEGGWAMLYTGVSSEEQGLVQRIGLARSHDLTRWVKHPDNPILEADPRWYEILDLDVWFDQAWRDPWLTQDPGSGLFHAFVTARSRSGLPAGRGVIGHATSPNLSDWEVGPPISAPEGFGYMEIPQVFSLEGRWHLLFSAPAWAQSLESRHQCTGTFHAISEKLDGPYEELAPLFCDVEESLYGGKVIDTAAGPACLAFHNQNRSGAFVGGITDPMPVVLAPGGTIALVESHPQRKR
jgi:beta-fructofuranosidase